MNLDKVTCKICNNTFVGYSALSRHIKKYHNITTEQYYLLDHTQPLCENPNCKNYHIKKMDFLSLALGYKIHCNSSCAVTDPKTEQKRINTVRRKYNSDFVLQNSSIKQKSKLAKQKYANNNYDTEVYKSNRQHKVDAFKSTYNCVLQSELLAEYGQGWYKQHLVPIITDPETNMRFVSIKDIPTIQKYYDEHKARQKSYLEQIYFDYIKAICIDAVQSNRQIIYPYELDIFIPSKNIAFEVNGTRWHSIELGISKYYHQNKSKLARDKNIRLIHLYEFEDIDTNLELVSQLLTYNNDLFDKNRFDKYNVGICTEPNIIYKDKNYTIYDSGYRKENK